MRKVLLKQAIQSIDPSFSPAAGGRGAEIGEAPDDDGSITFGKASALVLKAEIHDDWTEFGLMSMNMEEATIAKWHKGGREGGNCGRQQHHDRDSCAENSEVGDPFA